MENDVLKNKIAPWQEKGRWYHVQVESDGSTWTPTKFSDPLDNLISSGYYLIPFATKTHTVIDVKGKVTGTVTAQFRTSEYLNVILHTASRDAILLPLATMVTGIVDVWFFAVEV